MPNWKDVVEEVQKLKISQQRKAQKAQEAERAAIDTTRRKYLRLLHEHTGRHTIAYYSGWLSKPQMEQFGARVVFEINDDDKNAFMMAVHKLKPREAGLDLLLHTPGGQIAATESLVDYLHQMFGKNIRAIIPQMAMSAGTMIACSCKEIVMGKQSNLGPTDPHVNGRPAHGIKKEFETAYKEIQQDRDRAYVWQPILAQYEPTLLG